MIRSIELSIISGHVHALAGRCPSCHFFLFCIRRTDVRTRRQREEDFSLVVNLS